jgi:hypothetical protein
MQILLPCPSPYPTPIPVSISEAFIIFLRMLYKRNHIIVSFDIDFFTKHNTFLINLGCCLYQQIGFLWPSSILCYEFTGTCLTIRLLRVFLLFPINLLSAFACRFL